jgi:hypothetical protein
VICAGCIAWNEYKFLEETPDIAVTTIAGTAFCEADARLALGRPDRRKNDRQQLLRRMFGISGQPS